MTDYEKLAHKRINLVATESKFRLSPIEALFFIVLFVLIGVFAKFAVYDPLMATAGATAEINRAQQELDRLITANKESSSLKEDYSRYVIENMTDEEASLLDRGEVIDMLQTTAPDVGVLSSLNISGNIVTITCYGVDLQAASVLVERLETDRRVASVTLSSAASRQDTGATATIKITMKSPGELAEDDEASGTGASTAVKGANDGQ